MIQGFLFSDVIQGSISDPMAFDLPMMCKNVCTYINTLLPLTSRVAFECSQFAKVYI